MPKLLGKKIAHLREFEHMTQMILASLMGIVKQAHVSNVEAGVREPSLDFVVRAAEVLGTDCDYLLRDSVPIEAMRASRADVSVTEGGRVVAMIEVKNAVPDKTRGALQHHGIQHFGAKLKYQRERRGWTQSELAHNMGKVTQAHISRLEAGMKQPSIEFVLACADFFDTSVDYWVRDMMPGTPEA